MEYYLKGIGEKPEFTHKYNEMMANGASKKHGRRSTCNVLDIGTFRLRTND